MEYFVLSLRLGLCKVLNFKKSIGRKYLLSSLVLNVIITDLKYTAITKLFIKSYNSRPR